MGRNYSSIPDDNLAKLLLKLGCEYVTAYHKFRYIITYACPQLSAGLQWIQCLDTL